MWLKARLLIRQVLKKEILEADRQAREIAKEMVAKKQVYTG